MIAKISKKRTRPGQCNTSTSKKGQGPARVNTTGPEEHPSDIPDSDQDPRNFQG